MKKSFSRIWALCLVATQIIAYPVSALSVSALDAAQSLAAEGIITYQSDAKNYKLQNPIIRQEAIAIVGKASGAVVGDDTSYQCRRVFGDVSEGWVCRSVEKAADAGIISKSNANFRPKDKVTYYEAAIMALKASCVNPNHAVNGNTDQERVLERAKEVGIDMASSMKQKPINRGDFFRYIYTVRSFVDGNPDQVDKTMPSCIQYEPYTVGDLTVNLPSTWNQFTQTPEEGGATYFDSEDGIMRVYINEYVLDTTLGVFYEGQRDGFRKASSGKVLSERSGPIAGTKIMEGQWYDAQGQETRNSVYYISHDGKMYVINFAFNTQLEAAYRGLMDSVFASAKVRKQNVTTNNPHAVTTLPKMGDTVLVHFKKTSESGKISETGDTVFEVGGDKVFPQIDAAIQLMRVGETRTVRIPAKEAYGELYTEETLTMSEFAELQQEALNGSTEVFEKKSLIGVWEKILTREEASAIFGTLSLGKEQRGAEWTFKIMDIQGNNVTVSFSNPSAIFYGKTLVVGAVANTGIGDITVQSIDGEEVTLLLKIRYEIVSQTATEVRVRLKNIHPLAGENIDFEITLVEIQKASPYVNNGISI